MAWLKLERKNRTFSFDSNHVVGWRHFHDEHGIMAATMLFGTDLNYREERVTMEEFKEINQAIVNGK